MTDTNEFLKEVEDLLDSNYAQFLERKPGQVQVYDTPPRLPEPMQAQSIAVEQPLPATKQLPTQKPSFVSELVVNAFVLFLLSALSDRLANR